MEKIYLVESEYVDDYEVLHSEKVAFKSKANAMREFNKKKKSIKKEFADGEGWEVEKTLHSYATYEDGYYAQNHACVTITEIPLNE